MTTADQRDAHLAESARKVRAALAGTRADLVVLPELSSIDYSRDAFACLDALAEPLDGPSFQTWGAVARESGVFVCYGFARATPDGYRIAMGVVGPDGTLVGHYDKLHLAQFGASMEREYFQRGTSTLAFDVGGFRFAPIICYDIRIPELSRTLVVDHGVDVILHCGAYFRDESFATWHHFTTTRALENQVYLLSLNRAGKDYGASRLCLPWQDEATSPVCFEETAEDIRGLTLNRDAIDTARRTYSFLADRLDDYRTLHAKT